MEKNLESVIAFYDSVAFEYDALMTGQDADTRLQVQSLFASCVKSGNVLDFGGGTGLDLPGFLSRNYNVFFVEPSVNMRRIAKAGILRISELCSLKMFLTFMIGANNVYHSLKR